MNLNDVIVVRVFNYQDDADSNYFKCFKTKVDSTLRKIVKKYGIDKDKTNEFIEDFKTYFPLYADCTAMCLEDYGGLDYGIDVI